MPKELHAFLRGPIYPFQWECVVAGCIESVLEPLFCGGYWKSQLDKGWSPQLGLTFQRKLSVFSEFCFSTYQTSTGEKHHVPSLYQASSLSRPHPSFLREKLSDRLDGALTPPILLNKARHLNLLIAHRALWLTSQCASVRWAAALYFTPPLRPQYPLL